MKIYKQCVSVHKYLNPPSKANRALASEWQWWVYIAMVAHRPWSCGKCVQLFFLFCENVFDLSLKWTCVFRNFNFFSGSTTSLTGGCFFLSFFVETLLTSANWQHDDNDVTMMSTRCQHLVRSAKSWTMNRRWCPTIKLPSCQTTDHGYKWQHDNESMTDEEEDGRWWRRRKWAQTMRLASFGP